MDILESVVGARDGAAIHQLAAQFGLSPEKVSAALGALMPPVAAGLKHDVDTNAAGLESALARGHHETYIEQPETLARPETTADGNAILGHIFGSKEVSRNVATGAAQKTGIDPAILKKMLPLIAAVAMGALAKRSKTTGGAATGAGGIGAMLEPLLDRDRDGSMMDDLTGMLGGMFGKKR